jgi:hypothetical protein
MDKEDKRKMEEYKKKPMANFADSANRSQFGDLSQLTKGNLLTRIITSVMVIGILSLIFFAINTKTEVVLSANEVAIMEIDSQSTNKIIYEKDKNSKEIQEFINAYNKAKPTDNSLGTTHNHEIVITLNNGDKITVFGGTQGFQTVQMNGQQFNIKGDKLWNYFKKL